MTLRSSLGRRLAATVFTAVWVMAGAARAADPARYALVIGANHGHADEPQLRFAASDARRLADVLTGLGDFLPDNIVLLEDPSADRVRDALARLNARMRTEAQPGSGMMLVFYSGHADGESLHLGEHALPWDELRNSTLGSAAAIRVLVVDACRSGAVTRVKGADVSKPFVVPPHERGVEGFALMSSAAAGESAQEADDLGGSFFTHHLVSGLQGAADVNHDGVVTLAEAYHYASERTQASTVRTLSGVQHPTYAYGLKGYSDLVLTRPARAEGFARVHLEQAADYFFWKDDASGPLVAEANVERTGTTLSLPPGRYFVQERLADRLYEGPVRLRRDQDAELNEAQLRAVTYDQWVRKGGAATRASYAVSAWGGIGSAPSALGRFGLSYTPGLMFTMNLRAITLDALAYGTFSDAYQSKITAHVRGGGAAFGVRKMFDVGPASLGFGARLGARYLDETYSTQRLAPARWQVAPTLDSLVRLDYHVSEAWFIGLEGRFGISVSRQGEGAAAPQWRVPTDFGAALGVGYQW